MIFMQDLEKLVDIADSFAADGGKWLLSIKGRKVHVYRLRLGGDMLTRIDVYDQKEVQHGDKEAK